MKKLAIRIRFILNKIKDFLDIKYEFVLDEPFGISNDPFLYYIHLLDPHDEEYWDEKDECLLSTGIGIVGDFSDWTNDWIIYVDSLNKKEFSTRITFDSPTEIKFRRNYKWDENWGGDSNKLIKNGPNIKILSKGEYDIVIDLNIERFWINKVYRQQRSYWDDYDF